MTGRIEGGNCIATVTFSADTPPKIATKPSDREIIAALVDAARQAKARSSLTRCSTSTAAHTGQHPLL